MINGSPTTMPIHLQRSVPLLTLDAWEALWYGRWTKLIRRSRTASRQQARSLHLNRLLLIKDQLMQPPKLLATLVHVPQAARKAIMKCLRWTDSQGSCRQLRGATLEGTSLCAVQTARQWVLVPRGAFVEWVSPVSARTSSFQDLILSHP